MKIKKNVFIDGTYAAFNPITEEIYYDKELDKFPELKRKIITHEKLHSKRPDDVIHHLRSDFIDYFKIHFTEEAHEYHEHLRETAKQYGMGKMIIYQVFNQLFIELVITPSLLMYYWFLNIKKKINTKKVRI